LKNIVGVVVTGLSIFGICGCESMEHGKNTVAAKAKLSKEDAVQIAMTKVPGGTVKEGELEMENGILIWSFDVATPNSKNITEVNINAVTGKIVAVDVETPEDQAKEAKADAREKKGEKAEKDDDDKDEKK
jgi:hypothetical protein